MEAAADPADDGQIVAKADDASGWQLKTVLTLGRTLWREGGWSDQYFCPTLQHHGPVVECVVSRCGSLQCVCADADIYVNGVLDNGTLSGTSRRHSKLCVNVNIGRRSGGYYFNGVIDDVRIYNRALSQAEIQADMNTPEHRLRHQHLRPQRHLPTPLHALHAIGYTRPHTHTRHTPTYPTSYGYTNKLYCP